MVVMATREDVREAVEIVAEPMMDNGWEPWRATHIEKEAYSILFAKPIEKPTLESAVCAIAAAQNKVARTKWKHAPLVIIFPFENYRLNVNIPSRSARGKHTIKIGNTTLRSYARADRKIARVITHMIKGNLAHLAGTSVQETLAALAWYRAVRPECMARNVELTVPTPYPDAIRYRTRMLRDFGVTIGEFDGLGVINGRIRVMEAKAANGGPRRWTNIIRHKLMSYSGAVPRLGKKVKADFVITSTNEILARGFARRTADLTRNVPFVGRTLAAWVRRGVRWEWA